jgi:hypothetical protein
MQELIKLIKELGFVKIDSVCLVYDKVYEDHKLRLIENRIGEDFSATLYDNDENENRILLVLNLTPESLIKIDEFLTYLNNINNL